MSLLQRRLRGWVIRCEDSFLSLSEIFERLEQGFRSADFGEDEGVLTVVRTIEGEHGDDRTLQADHLFLNRLNRGVTQARSEIGGQHTHSFLLESSHHFLIRKETPLVVAGGKSPVGSEVHEHWILTRLGFFEYLGGECL